MARYAMITAIQIVQVSLCCQCLVSLIVPGIGATQYELLPVSLAHIKEQSVEPVDPAEEVSVAPC